MIRVVNQKQALNLAGVYKPVFIQGLEDLYDLIVPIPRALLPVTVKRRGFEVRPIDKPTVYFSVKEDEDHWYCLYCVYHRLDWSYGQFGGPLRDTLDTHQHDFEGVLRAIPKLDRPVYEWNASIFHNDIKVYNSWTPVYTIEPQGHGIQAAHWNKSMRNYSFNTVEYVKYDLVDINWQWTVEHWHDIKTVFNENSVHMPDQWNDWRIRREYGKETDGLIYTDPAKLYELARKCQLM